MSDYLILSICNMTGELWVKIGLNYYIKRWKEPVIPLDDNKDPFISSHKPTRKE